MKAHTLMVGRKLNHWDGTKILILINHCTSGVPHNNSAFISKSRWLLHRAAVKYRSQNKLRHPYTKFEGKCGIWSSLYSINLRLRTWNENEASYTGLLYVHQVRTKKRRQRRDCFVFQKHVNGYSFFFGNNLTHSTIM